MKIEITERQERCFYEELLYVLLKYNQLKKKPTKKVYNLTKYLITYDLLVLLGIVLTALFYLNNNDKSYMLLLGMLIVLFVFATTSLVNANKKIKAFMNAKGKVVYEFNKEGINYSATDRNYKITWDKIKTVIINKYSICFIPEYNTDILMSLGIDSKDKVLKILEKYNMTHLLVDNNNLYK